VDPWPLDISKNLHKFVISFLIACKNVLGGSLVFCLGFGRRLPLQKTLIRTILRRSTSYQNLNHNAIIFAQDCTLFEYLICINNYKTYSPVMFAYLGKRYSTVQVSCGIFRPFSSSSFLNSTVSPCVTSTFS
jgi:hypothetical protein